MLLELKRWVVPPGHQVLVQDVSWSELEEILTELGEGRSARISYSEGLLEIMVPLPEHEDDKEIIGDFVKVLLEMLGLEFRSLGRIDLTVDPPPDLAIEIDITARTRFNNYERLGVPELWRYNGQVLEIYGFEDGAYMSLEDSRIFAGLDLRAQIPVFLNLSKSEGRMMAMKEFRAWVTQEMSLNKGAGT